MIAFLNVLALAGGASGLALNSRQAACGTSFTPSAPAVGAALVPAVAPPLDPPLPITSPNSLDAAFKALGKKYFGTAADQKQFQGRGAAVIEANFGQVTPENRCALHDMIDLHQ